MSGVTLPGIVAQNEGVAWLQLVDDRHPWVDGAALERLQDAVNALNADPDVRAVVVCGGSRHFCSGAPRETLTAPDAADRLAALTRGLPSALLDLEVPTIAAMEGHAVGGGFVLGLWCDLVVFAAESLYGAHFVTLGFSPGMGSTRALAEHFGHGLAQEMLYTGAMYKGRELAAAAPQVAHHVVARAEVRATAERLAESIAGAPSAGVRALKAMQVETRRAALDSALTLENARHRALFEDPATREAILAAYPTPRTS